MVTKSLFLLSSNGGTKSEKLNVIANFVKNIMSHGMDSVGFILKIVR